MKTYLYIAVLALFLLSSCSSSLYVSGEYDDLYYTPAPQEVYVAESTVPEQAYSSISEIEDKYDLDTLVADTYLDPAEYDKDLQYYDSNSRDAFDYYGGFSYSNHLNRFYGNYFDPYWRDPFYSGMRYGMSFGYPYYSHFGYRDPFYSPYYYTYARDPFYSPYWGSSYYYSPYSYYGYGGYGGWGISPYYRNYASNVEYYQTPVRRRSSYSTLSNRYVSGTSQRSNTAVNSSSRRTASSGESVNVSSGEGSRRTARSTVVSNNTNVRNATDPGERSVSSSSARRTRVNATTRAASKPEYRNSSRTYKPTYSNPRMSTRPAYNRTNSRSTTVRSSNQGSAVRSRSANVSSGNRSTGRSIINRSSGRSSSRSIINRSSSRSRSSFGNTRSSSVRSSGRSSSSSFGSSRSSSSVSRSSGSVSSSRSSSSSSSRSSGSSGSRRR